MFAKENDFESVKLVDFGLSLKYNLEDSVSLTEKCGTAIYMAPEVFRDYEYSKVLRHYNRHSMLIYGVLA